MMRVPFLAADPLEHVIDKPLVKVGQDLPVYLSTDGELWLLSNVTVMLVFCALLTCLIVVPAARRIQTGRQRTLDDFMAAGLLANLVETVCLYLRNDVFRGVLGDETDKYTPMLWTMFWFILICNLVGLVPFLDATAALGKLAGLKEFHGVGGTATQSIWVTGALALIAAIFYMGTALLKDPIGFLKHLTGGAPWFMWVIMIPVELMGYAIKPFALAIRLFANMTGGHLIIAVLLSFVYAMGNAVFTYATASAALAVPVSLASIVGAVAINLLEILVAFIQAYIFTFLTCLFLGQLVVHEHDEHDEHEEGDHGVHADPHTALALQDVPLKETGQTPATD